MAIKDVLIVGEYSGVAKNIASGFSALGANSCIIGSGDGFKRISLNGTEASKSNRYFDYVSQLVSAVSSLRKPHDLTIFLSPFVFRYPVSLNQALYKRIIGNSNKSILLCCTSDSVWWRHCPESEFRTPHLGYLKETGFIPHRYSQSKYYKSNLWIVSEMDGVAALMPEYKIPYQEICEHIKWVPFPFETSSPSSTNQRAKIYHGITRPHFKGSRLLIEIMDKFERPGLEKTISERVSYREFVSLLRQSVVYLDQVYSYAPAMSSLTALNHTPFVITGIQPITDPDMPDYFNDCPAYDVFDDHADIQASLLDPCEIESQLAINREFLRKYHDPQNVCSQIVEMLY